MRPTKQGPDDVTLSMSCRTTTLLTRVAWPAATGEEHLDISVRLLRLSSLSFLDTLVEEVGALTEQVGHFGMHARSSSSWWSVQPCPTSDAG